MAAPTSPAPGAPSGVPGRAEPEIHVMPEKYRGATLRAKLPSVPPPTAPRPVVPAPAPVKATGPGKGLIIGGGVVLLLLGVVAAAFFLPQRKSAVKAPTVPAANVAPAPPPVVPEPAPATSTPEAATSTPAAATSTPPEAEAPTGPLRNAPDTDADGLTDIEETEIYGTNAVRPDTDGDGYLDGGEVFYLYNPAGVAPVTLKESGIVRAFEDAALGFSALAPAAWQSRSEEGGGRFLGATGEFVQVTLQANPQALALADWYLAQSPGVSRDSLETFQTRTGLTGLRTADGMTAYFATSTRVYAVSYGVAGTRELSYRRTMEMLANSFKFVPVVVPAAPAGPAEPTAPTSTAPEGAATTTPAAPIVPPPPLPPPGTVPTSTATSTP